MVRRENSTLVFCVLVTGLICMLLECSMAPVAGGGTNTGDAVVGMVYVQEGMVLKPAANATVSFVHYMAHPDTAVERSVVTDQNGFYSLPWDAMLPADVYNLFAERDNKKAYVKQAIAKEFFTRLRTTSNTDTIGPITLKSAVTLQGVVNADTSINKQNVVILLLGSPYRPVTPDISGNILWDSIAAGAYDCNLVMRKSRDFSFSTALLVGDGTQTNTVFTLNADSLIVDNCEGDEQNNLWGYWYVYDDNDKTPNYYDPGNWDPVTQQWTDSLAGGNSAVTNFQKISPTEYEPFAMTDMSIDGGNSSGTPGHAAKIQFRMGTIQPATPDSTYGNYVGMGTQLVPDDINKRVLDPAMAIEITFWAKASIPMNVIFQVITDQGHFSLYGTYYQIIQSVTGEWREYTVYLREKDPSITGDTLFLAQPPWAFTDSSFFRHPLHPEINSGIMPLDISKATEIQWIISVDENMDTFVDQQQGSLWIDDLTIYYYNMAVAGGKK